MQTGWLRRGGGIKNLQPLLSFCHIRLHTLNIGGYLARRRGEALARYMRMLMGARVSSKSDVGTCTVILYRGPLFLKPPHRLLSYLVWIQDMGMKPLSPSILRQSDFQRGREVWQISGDPFFIGGLPDSKMCHPSPLQGTLSLCLLEQWPHPHILSPNRDVGVCRGDFLETGNIDLPNPLSPSLSFKR